MQPNDFWDKAADGKIEPFDVTLQVSSLEHSGLGRYGDALHPWGDLVTVARAWCITKPNGYFMTGMPFDTNGNDLLQFNEKRYYTGFLK